MTITFQDFLDSLEEDLRELPHSYQLAFAASCCERAYPNYEAFSRQEKWGDAAALKSALDMVWRFILEGNLSENERAALQSACEAATPDSDDFSPETSMAAVLITAAQEAAFMVRLLLQFCQDPQPAYAVRIATFARETIAAYVEAAGNLSSSDPEFETKVAQHPLMVAELNKERDDLQVLHQIGTSELEQFRANVKPTGRSNIGL